MFYLPSITKYVKKFFQNIRALLSKRKNQSIRVFSEIKKKQSIRVLSEFKKSDDSSSETAKSLEDSLVYNFFTETIFSGRFLFEPVNQRQIRVQQQTLVQKKMLSLQGSCKNLSRSCKIMQFPWIPERILQGPCKVCIFSQQGKACAVFKGLLQNCLLQVVYNSFFFTFCTIAEYFYHSP